MHNCEFDLPLGNATQYSEEFATIFMRGIQSSLSSTDMFYTHSRQKWDFNVIAHGNNSNQKICHKSEHTADKHRWHCTLLQLTVTRRHVLRQNT